MMQMKMTPPPETSHEIHMGREAAEELQQFEPSF